MSKHTPGPWYVDKSFTKHVIVRAKDRGQHIMEAFKTPGKIRTASANAHLISAAPELLALLKEYTGRDECARASEWHPKNCIYCLACAAIAKAEGKK